MPCKPCIEKKKRKEAMLNELNELDQPKPQPLAEPILTASIKCYCGITRILPAGLDIGSTVSLSPCLKCGSPFKGKYLGTTIEEID